MRKKNKAELRTCKKRRGRGRGRGGGEGICVNGGELGWGRYFGFVVVGFVRGLELWGGEGERGWGWGRNLGSCRLCVCVCVQSE